MARRVLLIVLTSGMLALGATSVAGAETRTLTLGQGAAFAILGHSCGGIQEKVYATGFAADGYPTGAAELSTSCGGSGRDGGGKTTKYTAWASVEWDWFGDTRSYGKLPGPPEGISTSFSAEDVHGDHLFNVGTVVHLETTSPPLKAPAAPTGVSAVSSPIEVGDSLELRFQVTWSAAPETAGLITSSTVTATPVNSTAPVLTTTVNGYGSGAILAPLEPNTTYSITVTNTDAEGTSEPSVPIEALSPNSEGEFGGGAPPEAGPEFGRCAKVFGNGVFTSSNCETESPTETGTYDWLRGVEARSFATAPKAVTVKLEAAGSKEKVTCTGESASGQVTGYKTVGDVVIRLTGCESLGGPCTTGALAAGELETSVLDGSLGIVSTTEKLGKETFHLGVSLHPTESVPFLEYTCSVSGSWTLGGALIAQVTSGKTSKTTSVKWAASGGKQKPEAFEGGATEVLTNQLGEHVGLTLTSSITYEEPVEINPVV
jgi:hypothetical protein